MYMMLITSVLRNMPAVVLQQAYYVSYCFAGE